jgi:hypothetical protein
VSDPRVIDVLLLKNQQEFQETMNQWKMPDQLLGMFLQPKQRQPRTFMQKFLEGAYLVRGWRTRRREAYVMSDRSGRGRVTPRSVGDCSASVDADNHSVVDDNRRRSLHSHINTQ